MPSSPEILISMPEQERSALFESLRMMMISPWWSRVWVVQELVVAPKVSVRYGTAVAPWELFVKTAQIRLKNEELAMKETQMFKCLAPEYADVLSLFAHMVLGLDDLRKQWSNSQTDLLTLTRRFSNRKASHDRDKVYALLGFLRTETTIRPDYEREATQVYQNTILDIMRSVKSSFLLTGDLGRKNY
ncbi:hypothetical protein K469DRAFT_772109 [Zopfia rhizophila CBS 207.26]|uniref:Heterokaryon incompatibility domain-containing protein n=1 Tax=Zopfia rhizophila CBS 207.26 TaxID=1314779 RepID=A0A6A6EBG8_9PEZI|nr:hypothetical protein K469DRAFT_772109 [Zopfia rhizophila CBS 207.26]